MSLANLDREELRRKIMEAYDADVPHLQQFREYARHLRDGVKPLRTYWSNAVASVSADGGENRLAFNPVVVELIRVMDSRGVQHALDVVGGAVTLAELEERVRPESKHAIAPLIRLAKDIGKTLGEMSNFVRSIEVPDKSAMAMRSFRDIVEWSVLYDLVANPDIQWPSDTILVRDGLLRAMSFSPKVFPLLDEKLRAGIAAQRNVQLSLVGVAKRSAVLGRLAVALELEATFHKDYPCYVRVDEDIEKACYDDFDRRWVDTYETAEEDDAGRRAYQSLGRLHLVKFGDRPMDPVWPVDVAAWQMGQADRILGQLTADAQQGFPIPDYPMCIQRAHDLAKLSGFEVEDFQDMLFQGICRNLTPEESERLLRMKYLGQTLAELRYKET